MVRSAVTLVKRTRETKMKIEAVLENLRQGHTIEFACNKAKMARTNYYECLETEPGLRERHYQIIDSRTLVIEDALYKSAAKGNTAAQIFWLKSRNGKRWNENPYDGNDHMPDRDILIKEIKRLTDENGFNRKT